MPEINLPTATKQDLIKAAVDAVKEETTLIKNVINNPVSPFKILKSKVYNANGTFVVPAGVTEVYLTGGGAGGAGGGAGGSATSGGGAGGVTSFGSLLSLSGGRGGLSTASGSGGSGGAAGGPGGQSGAKAGQSGGDGGSAGWYSGGAGGEGFVQSGGAGFLPADGQAGSLCSGGGGAGGQWASAQAGGGGGGGGSFVIDAPVSVVPGSSVPVQVGISQSTGGSGTAAGGVGGNGILTVKWWE